MDERSVQLGDQADGALGGALVGMEAPPRAREGPLRTRAPLRSLSRGWPGALAGLVAVGNGSGAPPPDQRPAPFRAPSLRPQRRHGRERARAGARRRAVASSWLRSGPSRGLPGADGARRAPARGGRCYVPSSSRDFSMARRWIASIRSADVPMPSGRRQRKSSRGEQISRSPLELVR